MSLSYLVAIAVLGQANAPFPTKPLNLSGAFDMHGHAREIDTSKAKATVLFFVATDCPIANRYAPEIARIHADYRKKGVDMFRVYLLPKENRHEVEKHSTDFKLRMPALLDPELKLVKATGVKVTPEVAVIGLDGILRYRGRIDDQNIEHGKARTGYRKDLRIALDELLAGKTVSVRETAAVGCFIQTS